MLSTLFFFSNPPTIRSSALSKWAMVMHSAASRAAVSAASLHAFMMSAPENPADRVAKPLASSSFVVVGSVVMGFRCTFQISMRSASGGASRATCRSKRPGRSSALSSTSGRLVPASTTTPAEVLKPSISTSRAFSVLSRSSLRPPLLPPRRLRPMASISSMKIMHGAFFRASLNMSRTRDGPTPTKISTKSDPEMLRNGTPASPAVALAKRVLPTPGGPVRRQPFGMRAPRSLYFFGSFRKSTSSSISFFGSSKPATSANVVFTFFAPAQDHFFFANMPPSWPPDCFNAQKMNNAGRHEINASANAPRFVRS
mmetsp:Transcript_11732/g.21273  ORF Transcript_11732/g.21273 Transcript_11732/m.21273 type:complete len:313 (+) Transcript_11732:736-1674(+)